jgi:hypothetical protein
MLPYDQSSLTSSSCCNLPPNTIHPLCQTELSCPPQSFRSYSLNFTSDRQHQCVNLHLHATDILMLALAALVVSKQAYGRTLTLQVGVPFLASLIVYSMYKAVTSIRNLHVDQHRAWILRTWAYAGSVRLYTSLLHGFLTLITYLDSDSPHSIGG